jgi:small-conductance mechanosensitive channel
MQDVVTQTMDVTSQMWSLLRDLSIRFVTWAATSGTRIVLIAILTWGALAAVGRLMVPLHREFVGSEPSYERTKRADTLTAIVRTVSRIFIALASTMMILKEIGIEIAPVLATAGVGGLALGFGAQSLVKDVISGFFLLLEDQVRVGDIVQVEGRTGQVEKITLRTISIRDLSGSVHVIPNGSVNVVMNMTKDYSRYVFDVAVAHREDPDEVFAVLAAIGEELQKDATFGPMILEPLEILGVDSFAASAVIIKARIKTLPIKQWVVGREFNRRMKKRFDELGIEIPFPHVTLYPGEDKRGSAPALRLVVRRDKVSETKQKGPGLRTHAVAQPDGDG